MTERLRIPPRGGPYRSAGELAQALLKREISALELTDQFIAQIEALDEDLNAAPVRDFARARKRRDKRMRPWRGERRPLLGVPVTVKESYKRRRIADYLGHTRVQGFRR